jgi:NADPH:quinone reductase-like Zn-dependent oxidoreductase
VVQHGNGGPEVLGVADVPVREPGEGQVLVQVYAAGINPVDWKQREGINGRPPGAPAPAAPATPVTRIPGSDIAGVVAKVGPGVTSFKVGDAVAGSAGGGGDGLNGAYAQYALATANRLIAKPRSLTFAEAAGLNTGNNTAALALYRLQLKAGQKLVVTGVAGGVGSAMAQLAKAQGVYVIGTASARHNAYLKTIGVDEVIDYTQGDWTTHVHNVDAVFDTVGGATADQALTVLKPHGSFIGIARENGEPEGDKCTSAGIDCVALRPSRPGDPTDADLMTATARLADAGKFMMHVDASFPLDKAGEAQELSRQGHTEGKIVLVIDPAHARSK